MGAHAASEARPLISALRLTELGQRQKLQPILNAAIEQSFRVETELADFLKASPVLARYLARWQAAD
jgi:hypothetical protein